MIVKLLRQKPDFPITQLDCRNREFASQLTGNLAQLTLPFAQLLLDGLAQTLLAELQTKFESGVELLNHAKAKLLPVKALFESLEPVAKMEVQ